MANCAVCRTNTSGAYLCAVHTTYLGDILDMAIWLVKEGEVTETRQDKLDQAPRTGSVHSSVVNFGAMRVLDELWMLLRDMVANLVADNGLKFLPACSVGTHFIGPLPRGWKRLPQGYSADSRQLLLWLHHHLTTLVSRHDVGTFYKAMIGFVGDPDKPSQPGSLMAMINKRSRTFAGLCPTVVGYDHRDGVEICCDVSLWALDGDVEATCPRCGYSVDIVKNRTRCAVSRDLMTEKAAAETMTTIGEPLSVATIGNWIRAGSLKVRGFLHQGQVVEQKIRVSDPRLISLSQARSVRAQRLHQALT